MTNPPAESPISFGLGLLDSLDTHPKLPHFVPDCLKLGRLLAGGEVFRLGVDERSTAAHRGQDPFVLELLDRNVNGQLGNAVLVRQRAQRRKLLPNLHVTSRDLPA
ncbi:hypothetical protein DFQ14_101173 [Halopolyspora algeriensis]|uniref:Uncharacterized protein n=1 Tax=Halopolyspora algeriensis TaxID=1500506 RepID=A0A368W0T7_9ACTN|nr:hypothetical protein DFQ14_101173 [Halopolyspora algeriensis]TQM47925.1 hypothetical protein FHU43_2876 [Halopolyspora algeriensis]